MGQVVFWDADLEEFPEWRTGAETVVCSPEGFYISTQPDEAGAVRLQVLSVPPEGMVLLHMGRMFVRSGWVEFGSLITGERQRMKATVGWHGVAIFANQPCDPSHIVIWFDVQNAASVPH